MIRNAEVTSAATGITYWVDEDGIAREIVEDYEPVYDEDGDLAFARMLERRAEEGTWWGR